MTLTIPPAHCRRSSPSGPTHRNLHRKMNIEEQLEKAERLSSPSLVGSSIRLADDSAHNNYIHPEKYNGSGKPGKYLILNSTIGASLDDLISEGALLGSEENFDKFLDNGGHVKSDARYLRQQASEAEEQGDSVTAARLHEAADKEESAGEALVAVPAHDTPSDPSGGTDVSLAQPDKAATDESADDLLVHDGYSTPNLSEYQLEHGIGDHRLFVNRVQSHDLAKLPLSSDRERSKTREIYEHQLERVPHGLRAAAAKNQAFAQNKHLDFGPSARVIEQDSLHAPYFARDERSPSRSRASLDRAVDRLRSRSRSIPRPHLARGDSYKNTHEDSPSKYELPADLAVDEVTEDSTDRRSRQARPTMGDSIAAAEKEKEKEQEQSNEMFHSESITRDPSLVTTGDYTNFNADAPSSDLAATGGLYSQRSASSTAYLRLISRSQSRQPRRDPFNEKNDADTHELVREGALVSDDPYESVDGLDVALLKVMVGEKNKGAEKTYVNLKSPAEEESVKENEENTEHGDEVDEEDEEDEKKDKRSVEDEGLEDLDEREISGTAEESKPTQHIDTADIGAETKQEEDEDQAEKSEALIQDKQNAHAETEAAKTLKDEDADKTEALNEEQDSKNEVALSGEVELAVQDDEGKKLESSKSDNLEEAEEESTTLPTLVSQPASEGAEAEAEDKSDVVESKEVTEEKDVEQKKENLPNLVAEPDAIIPQQKERPVEASESLENEAEEAENESLVPSTSKTNAEVEKPALEKATEEKIDDIDDAAEADGDESEVVETKEQLPESAKDNELKGDADLNEDLDVTEKAAESETSLGAFDLKKVIASVIPTETKTETVETTETADKSQVPDDTDDAAQPSHTEKSKSEASAESHTKKPQDKLEKESLPVEPALESTQPSTPSTAVTPDADDDDISVLPEELRKHLQSLPIYLFTSLAGGMKIIQKTNRLATIMQGNGIKFEYRDLGTDEEAKKLWRRYAQGKLLPGVVRGDDFIGDLTYIEEVNEEYRLHEVLYETL